MKINRRLECIENIDSVGASLYKDKFYNVSYVPSDMKFEIIEVIDVESYGMRQIGRSRYALTVLKDENRLLSTELLSSIDDDGPCCNRMTPHLKKLFRYIEKNGKARVLVTVYDLNTKKSDAVTQQFVLNGHELVSSSDALLRLTARSLRTTPRVVSFNIPA